jgi:molybdopterin synthase sulfur carrier subunit
MAIKVLVFGQISEIISQTELEFASLKNTEELSVELSKRYPMLTQVKYAIAVNKKIVVQNTALSDNDIVALLPPFSGG